MKLTTPTSTDSPVSATTQHQRRRLVAPGLAAAVAAAVATTLVAVISKGAGVDFADSSGEEIPLFAFAQLTLTFSLIGLAVAAGIRRWGKRPATTFLRTALALTAISLVPPFLIGLDLASSACLVVAHLTAAAIVIPTLTRSLGTPSVSLP
ncbi:MAG TPA: DUF6069 family protein [Nocardioidaceae bacterium]|nr:DUF6069 family protein [Nocardioidaceae bacterium]